MAFKKKAKKGTESFHFEFEERGGTMRGAEEMRNLTQEIVHSFESRMGQVAAIKDETVTMLRGFRQEMKNVQEALRKKSGDLKRFLMNAETSRMNDFRAMHQGIRARQEERNGEVAGMLGGFHRQQASAASHWQHMATMMARKRASVAR